MHACKIFHLYAENLPSSLLIGPMAYAAISRERETSLLVIPKTYYSGASENSFPL